MAFPPEQQDASDTPPSVVSTQLSSRAFAFYPPIRNIPHNTWRFVRETWAEMLVSNEESAEEVWIPRRFLGTVSSVDEPFPIVGLQKELEFRAGSVWPYRSKLLEMPHPGRPHNAASTRSGEGNTPVPAAPKRRGTNAERSVTRLILIVTGVAFLAIFAVLAVYKGDGIFGNRVVLQTADQEYLSLRAGDDYYAVVKHLGKPADDRWRAQSKELAFRALDYPERGYSIILFGADQSNATYIGAMDTNWRPVHSVAIGRGVDSSSMLRNLKRF